MAKTDFASKVVTGSGVSRRPRLVLLVVLGVLVLAAVAGYMVWQSTATPKVPETPSSASDAGAIAAAKQEVAAAHTPAQQATAYDHLGQAYYNSDQLANALNAYTQGLAAVPAANNQSTGALRATLLADRGVAYFRVGNYAAEVADLQELIGIYQRDGTPAERALIPHYQQLIQELQGLPQS